MKQIAVILLFLCLACHSSRRDTKINVLLIEENEFTISKPYLCHAAGKYIIFDIKDRKEIAVFSSETGKFFKSFKYEDIKQFSSEIDSIKILDKISSKYPELLGNYTFFPGWFSTWNGLIFMTGYINFRTTDEKYGDKKSANIVCFFDEKMNPISSEIIFWASEALEQVKDTSQYFPVSYLTGNLIQDTLYLSNEYLYLTNTNSGAFSRWLITKQLNIVALPGKGNPTNFISLKREKGPQGGRIQSNVILFSKNDKSEILAFNDVNGKGENLVDETAIKRLPNEWLIHSFNKNSELLFVKVPSDNSELDFFTSSNYTEDGKRKKIIFPKDYKFEDIVRQHNNLEKDCQFILSKNENLYLWRTY